MKALMLALAFSAFALPAAACPFMDAQPTDEKVEKPVEETTS